MKRGCVGIPPLRSSAVTITLLRTSSLIISLPLLILLVDVCLHKTRTRGHSAASFIIPNHPSASGCSHSVRCTTVLTFTPFVQLGLQDEFCYHILLRECHVRDVVDTASTLWFYVGNEVIRFRAVEFCLVTGLTFGDSCESPSYITKHMDKRILRSYFRDGKLNVKMFANWFRNLSPDNNLVDDLDAFNSFPWGIFLYGRIFDSLSTCVVRRDDKYKERLESPAKRKAENYNVYGFVTAFQVWAIEAIPKWAMLGYASRILFPANVNGNHWVAIVVDLKERVITIYDSLP
ncbi:hypothetical protein Ddye_005587 [Dipteronia dyeriana]|uniref:Ubiquitin-like protease family profile domain-containing protein n=1 Tax=Dipteronia dyeriana TaxID=168575 RepID=A0AAD9XGL0_9ROSI|nr:hypothetical protein Ddye_005587 [Dipteronia dyeriana]